LNSPAYQKLSGLFVEILGESNDFRIIDTSWKVVNIISKWAISFNEDVLSSVSLIKPIYEIWGTRLFL
jgi:hypothetical protein